MITATLSFCFHFTVAAAITTVFFCYCIFHFEKKSYDITFVFFFSVVVIAIFVIISVLFIIVVVKSIEYLLVFIKESLVFFRGVCLFML